MTVILKQYGNSGVPRSPKGESRFVTWHNIPTSLFQHSPHSFYLAQPRSPVTFCTHLPVLPDHGTNPRRCKIGKYWLKSAVIVIIESHSAERQY
jgi:hypothetical protein